MGKHKRFLLLLISIIVCAILTVPFMNGSSFGTVNADYYYTILESGMFTQDVTISGNSYTFNCYRIKDHDTSIAIAWGQSASSTPASLPIPDVITSNKPTGSNVDYTIVAIARAGFSHCTFTTITLPQTVRDIREEAFAYCQNMTSFRFPKDVTMVAPSTFLDCRKLTSVYYSSEDGKKTLSNSKITSFGDHSFDSCVSLRRIQCPSSATYFGQSCFQKCSSLTIFRFPYDNGETGENQNVITVEDYAFADCSYLQRVYFDINMLNISDYAFADSKTDLTFYFYGSQAEFPASLSAKWRNKKITFGSDGVTDYSTQVYNIEYNTPKTIDGGYPGLTCSLSNAARPLDNARTDSTSNTTSVYVIPAGGPTYATIEGFETPEEDDWIEGYYYDGVLTIPDSINYLGVDYPVKVIGALAFKDNDDIEEVYFNHSLVQICNKAFYHSNNISIINFDDCENLVEIGYSIFNDIQLLKKYENSQNDAINDYIDKTATLATLNKNTLVTSIVLPNSLQYLGNFAFYNFMALTEEISFKTNKSQPSQLKIIGDYAFAVYSESGGSNNSYLDANVTPSIDLELPNSLDDSYAPLANIWHSFSWDRKGGGPTAFATVHQSIWNRVAINKNAFENQDGIRTVKMEEGGTPHDISFGSNVFVRATSLIRFESSDNLCLLGNEAFKMCSNLREVFLSADRATANTHGCNSSGVLNGTTITDPWGVGDGTNYHSKVNGKDYGQNVFHTDDYKEIVIYVKGSGSDKYPNTNSAWQGISTTTSYQSEITTSKRNSLPVYYVDWTTTGNVKYWHVNDGDNSHPAKNELLDIEDGPQTLADYNNGYISFVKKSNNKYLTARYFTDGNAANFAKTINLTSSTLSGMTIDEIGHESFAGGKSMGYYFVLPTTVTTIRERAFFRTGNINRGVRIVTFKNGNTIQAYSGSASTFDQLVATINGQADAVKAGYCCLPTSVTRIENCAFYNNIFASIELGTGVSFLGNDIFYTHKDGNNLRGKNQSFAFTNYNGSSTNSNFTVINDGIYYTRNANKKMLLHQANNITGTLTVASGTKAIGNRAAAGTKYSEVVFDNDTTIIYGQAFAYCLNLTTLTNVSQLKYICGSVISPDAEVNNDNTYYQKNTDGNGGTADAYSFQGCTNLKVDFSQMTAIKKIGDGAFKSCTNLVTDLSLTKTYEFWTYTHSDTSLTQKTGTAVDQILDLSTLSNLRYIGKDCFVSCNIDYAILPNTTGENYSNQSQLTCGGSAVFNNSSTYKLCGETAQQADQSGNSSLNPKTHYPVAALSGDYTHLYYRVHSEDDILSAQTTRRYWTAVKTGNANQVKIILFESKEDAIGWLGVTANLNSQCHTFPES
ncbi:MAG: leucine-rich repeat protein [Bacilli bacterium]|nr:leucine-rich repeat protein [Bacilli bacterium]